MAKIAEQAERYDGKLRLSYCVKSEDWHFLVEMVSYMKDVAKVSLS